MSAFITREELEAYLDGPIDDSHAVLSRAMRKASLMVAEACRYSVWEKDASGQPTGNTLHAFKLAVLAQVSFWKERDLLDYANTVNTAEDVQRVVESYSFNGTTTKFAKNDGDALVRFAKEAAVKSLVSLCEDARLELSMAGLLSPQDACSYVISGFTIYPDVPGFVTQEQLSAALSTIKLEDLDASGFTSKKELQEAIDAIKIPEVDLSGLAKKSDLDAYATDEELSAAIAKIKPVDVSNLATKEELKDAVANIDLPQVDLSGLAKKSDLDAYATDEDLSAAIAGIQHPTVDLSHLATKSELAAAVAGIEPGEVDLSSLVTKSELEEGLAGVTVDLTPVLTKIEEEASSRESADDVLEAAISKEVLDRKADVRNAIDRVGDLELSHSITSDRVGVVETEASDALSEANSVRRSLDHEIGLLEESIEQEATTRAEEDARLGTKIDAVSKKQSELGVDISSVDSKAVGAQTTADAALVKAEANTLWLTNIEASVDKVVNEGATDAELAEAIANLNVSQYETITHATDTYATKLSLTATESRLNQSISEVSSNLDSEIQSRYELEGRTVNHIRAVLQRVDDVGDRLSPVEAATASNGSEIQLLKDQISAVGPGSTGVSPNIILTGYTGSATIQTAATNIKNGTPLRGRSFTPMYVDREVTVTGAMASANASNQCDVSLFNSRSDGMPGRCVWGDGGMITLTGGLVSGPGIPNGEVTIQPGIYWTYVNVLELGAGPSQGFGDTSTLLNFSLNYGRSATFAYVTQYTSGVVTDYTDLGPRAFNLSLLNGTTSVIQRICWRIWT